MSGIKERSLALTLGLHIGVVIVGAMGMYAVLQYYLSPGHTLAVLAFEHLSHLVVLGAAIYAALYFVLSKKVVKPVAELYAKLYAIAGGDSSPVSVDSSIREIQEIAQGINLMLAKIDTATPEFPLARLSQVSTGLREAVRRSTNMDEQSKKELLEAAIVVDEAVASVTKDYLQSRPRSAKF